MYIGAVSHLACTPAGRDTFISVSQTLMRSELQGYNCILLDSKRRIFLISASALDLIIEMKSNTAPFNFSVTSAHIQTSVKLVSQGLAGFQICFSHNQFLQRNDTNT